jgi:hypothetical protein
MQILVQTICTKGSSIRVAILKDKALSDYGLCVLKQKSNKRSNGWAKLHSADRSMHGAINISWEANSQILLARIVSRGEGNPSSIIGDFVGYLLARHKRRVQSISIHPREK